MRIRNSFLESMKGESFAFAVIALAALLSRLYPLSMSPYPFNNDSMTEFAIASDILNTGHLDFSDDYRYSTHSIGIPVFNVVLPFVSAVLGTSPLECGQMIIAIVSMVTVLGIFLLARLVTGSMLGAVTAGFMAIMMGTFVYTTGSVWKEALGISFMMLALLAFVNRTKLPYRLLLVLLLFVLPVTHHLVTAIVLLTLSLAVAWSWFLALTGSHLKRRHFEDLLTVALPVAFSYLYYSGISFGSSPLFTSRIIFALAPAFFFLLCILVIVMLSRRSHLRITFAPLVGLGVGALLVLDYFGFLFPYTPSAAVLFYMLLVGATATLATVAWFGTELILESKPTYRTVQLCLLLAPLAIMGVAVASGLSYSSHKVIYRSFDFLDIPVFIGIAYSLVFLKQQKRRAFAVLAVTVIVAASITFPFGFESERLLGVRHDTQPYEVDALYWLSGRNESANVVSDERIAYVSFALLGGFKNNFLPNYLMLNESLAPWSYYFVEDSWTTRGVNDYPRGEVVIPDENYTKTLMAADVLYIGGPVDDRLQIFRSSGIGQWFIYGPWTWPPEDVD